MEQRQVEQQREGQYQLPPNVPPAHPRTQTCLPSNYLETAAARTTENTVLLLFRECMLRALPNNGRYLQSNRLATGLYATILKELSITISSFLKTLNKALHLQGLKCLQQSIGLNCPRFCPDKYILHMALHISKSDF
jgi:hypothetical protein